MMDTIKFIKVSLEPDKCLIPIGLGGGTEPGLLPACSKWVAPPPTLYLPFGPLGTRLRGGRFRSGDLRWGGTLQNHVNESHYWRQWAHLL